MKLRTLPLLILLPVFLLTGSGCSRPERSQLSLRLTEGKSLRFRMQSSQQITQTVTGRPRSMSQKMGIDYRWDVTKILPSGAALVKVTFEAVRVSLSTPDLNCEMDSQSRIPPEKMPAAVRPYAALAGEGFLMTIQRDGAITEVQGMEELVAAVRRKTSPVPDPAAPAPAAPDAPAPSGAPFSSATVREMIEKMGIVYPPRPITVGDSWTRSTVVTGAGFPLKADTTCTVKSRQQGTMDIEIVSALKSDPAAVAAVQGGHAVSYELSGEQKGTCQIEEGSGVIRLGSLEGHWTGTIRVRDAAGKTYVFPTDIQMTNSLVTR